MVNKSAAPIPPETLPAIAPVITLAGPKSIRRNGNRARPTARFTPEYVPAAAPERTLTVPQGGRRREKRNVR
jgi:hypothetical protein